MLAGCNDLIERFVLIATDPWDPNGRVAGAALRPLAPANQIAAVVSGWVGKVDLTDVRELRFELEQLLEELEINR